MLLVASYSFVTIGTLGITQWLRAYERCFGLSRTAIGSTLTNSRRLQGRSGLRSWWLDSRSPIASRRFLATLSVHRLRCACNTFAACRSAGAGFKCLICAHILDHAGWMVWNWACSGDYRRPLRPQRRVPHSDGKAFSSGPPSSEWAGAPSVVDSSAMRSNLRSTPTPCVGHSLL